MKQGDVYSNGIYKCVIVIPKAVNPVSNETYVAYKTLKENAVTVFIEQKDVFEQIYTFEYNLYEKSDNNPPVCTRCNNGNIGKIHSCIDETDAITIWIECDICGTQIGDDIRVEAKDYDKFVEVLDKIGKEV